MEVCRLCLDLQSSNDCSPLEGTYKDKVQVVAPELNLEISTTPVVCNECVSYLDKLFLFKTKSFENEAQIRTKCDKSKNNLGLKEVLDGRSDTEGALKPNEAKERVCRTCMWPIESESFTSLKPFEPDAFLDSMMTMCLPEVDLELTKDPVICATCFGHLQELHHFKSTCLDIEDKLADFCETHGTNSNDQINLHGVLEFANSKMDEDPDFVNIKSEPITKIDDESGDAGVKSENDAEMMEDVKLKHEEVDIKSEAGGNESDNDVKTSEATSNNKKKGDKKCCDETSAARKTKTRYHPKIQKCTKWILKTCKHCAYQSFYPYEMRKHEDAHKNLQGFQCTECPFKTIYNGSLQRHLLISHDMGDKSKVKECSQCDFKTLSNPHLKRHIATVHGNSKQCKCFECNFKTSDKQYLKAHVQTVHEKIREQGTLIRCTQCKYRSPDPFALSRHKRSSH